MATAPISSRLASRRGGTLLSIVTGRQKTVKRKRRYLYGVIAFSCPLSDISVSASKNDNNLAVSESVCIPRSLKLWRELFGETSFIYGVDIDPGVPAFPRDGHIKSLVFDSRYANMADKALKGIASSHLGESLRSECYS